MQINMIMIFALLALLSACNSGDVDAQKEAKPKMFETQLDALDKAKGVEGMVLESAEERKKSYDP